jgi:hypothetical protein
MTIGLSPVLRLVKPGVLLHWCEACDRGHTIDVHDQNEHGRRLGWDGDMKAPTIAEMIQQREGESLCEYELRAGYVVFSPRCTHAMAGKVRMLPIYPMPKP